jgi:hypothetical protein
MAEREVLGVGLGLEPGSLVNSKNIFKTPSPSQSRAPFKRQGTPGRTNFNRKLGSSKTQKKPVFPSAGSGYVEEAKYDGFKRKYVHRYLETETRW